jgi:hypothetical protein
MTAIDESVLCDRLPELNLIRGQLQHRTAEAFLDGCPAYFWWVRASSSHHPEDERGAGGLWLHVRRSFTAWLTIERPLREMSIISQYEANCARSAILLHDLFKYGLPNASYPDEELGHDYLDESNLDTCDHESVPSYALDDHDEICANWLDANTAVPDAVIRCVRTHNGGWYDGPSPDSMLEIGHHLADYLSAQPHNPYPIIEAVGDDDDSYDANKQLYLLNGRVKRRTPIETISPNEFDVSV